MIQHSPAERYFVYLVVHPSTYDNEYIKTLAQELSIDYLGDWYVQRLRERTRPPRPFYPEDRAHAKSQKFLMREGIQAAFSGEAHWSTALRVLNYPRQRELVETMLLSRAPTHAICRALLVRHRAKVSERAIDLYRHFFWDVDLLDGVEMRALLDMRGHGVLNTSNVAEMTAQLGSIKRVRHTDPRVIAARLPHTPLAAALAQLELGVLPTKLDLSAVIDQALQVTLLRGMEAAMNGGPVGASMSRDFLSGVTTLQELRELVTDPESKLRSDLKRISLATTDRQVPTVAQLTSGRHTTNVHPEPKAEPVDAEFVEEDGDFDDEPDDAGDEGDHDAIED